MQVNSPATTLAGHSFGGADDRTNFSPTSSIGTDLEAQETSTRSPNTAADEQSQQDRIAGKKKRKCEASKRARERKKAEHVALLRRIKTQDLTIAEMRKRVEELEGQNVDLAERCCALWAQLQAFFGMLGRQADLDAAGRGQNGDAVEGSG